MLLRVQQSDRAARVRADADGLLRLQARGVLQKSCQHRAWAAGHKTACKAFRRAYYCGQNDTSPLTRILYVDCSSAGPSPEQIG
ncbi:hypothetical protein WJX81_001653 [Elliptochloris bilobata]|uniref:Uncharacterized protein n=1 Tax=Elliptochloris bilobata TaxID=381761 RepID=A0AAW1S892_9CHLO